MPIVAGCDGGGTKCHARVCVVDETGVVVHSGDFVSGPANVRSDPEAATRNIKTATCEAVVAAGLSATTRIDRFVAALAGAGDSSRQKEWQARLSSELPAEKIDVVPDAAILFAAADVRDDVDAVATIIGTGAIAWATTKGGTVSRAGGRGPLVGDEGSGYWIGREAIRRCSKLEASEIEPTLSAKISNVDGEGDIARIASLSEDVFRLAKNTALFQTILEDAADEISTLLVDATAEIETRRQSPLPWVCAGGVAVNQREWLGEIRSRCVSRGLHFQSPKLVSEPVEGAIKMALKT